MAYDSNNLFAKMLRGEIAVEPVYRDEHVMIIRDIHPAAPTHLLAIPNGSYTSFQDFVTIAEPNMVANFFATIARFLAAKGIDQNGYRLVSNHGKEGGQSIPHFHVHILAGKHFTDL
jgi:histidine triad (HIT) family protein